MSSFVAPHPFPLQWEMEDLCDVSAIAVGVSHPHPGIPADLSLAAPVSSSSAWLVDDPMRVSTRLD